MKMRIWKQLNKRHFITMLTFRTSKLHWKLTKYYEKQITASQKKIAMRKWKWPSREAFKGRTNSVNSVSSRLLKTSSAVIICLFDSLQMSLALHIHTTPITVQLLLSQKVIIFINQIWTNHRTYCKIPPIATKIWIILFLTFS